MVSKLRTVIITFNARASLKDHIKYLKENISAETAEHVRKGVLKKCQSLKDFSGYSIERYLEDEPKEYRSVTQWDYNIIYIVEKSEIRILDIIHTSQHPNKRQRAKE